MATRKYENEFCFDHVQSKKVSKGFSLKTVFKKETCFPKTLFQQRYRDANVRSFENNYSVELSRHSPLCIIFVTLSRWFASTFKVLTGIVPGYLLGQTADVKKERRC